MVQFKINLKKNDDKDTRKNNGDDFVFWPHKMCRRISDNVSLNLRRLST